MNAQVNIRAAKARFSELMRRVEAGEEIVIVRRHKAVAKLVPVPASPKGKRQFGSLKGLVALDDSFWDPLPDDFLDPSRRASSRRHDQGRRTHG